MNRVPIENRCLILHMLAEGMSLGAAHATICDLVELMESRLPKPNWSAHYRPRLAA